MKYVVILLCTVLSFGCSDKTKKRKDAHYDLMKELGEAKQTVFKTKNSPVKDSLIFLLNYLSNPKMKHTSIIQRKYIQKTFDYLPEVEIVIETKTKRYTLYYAQMYPSLSLWVRPIGTTSRSALSNIVDEGADGFVDFGVQNTTEKLFSSEKMFGEDRKGVSMKSTGTKNTLMLCTTLFIRQ